MAAVPLGVTTVCHPGFVWLMPVMTRNLLAPTWGSAMYIVLGAWLEERKLWLNCQSYEQYRRDR
jgi:hypothetical protein